MGEHHIDDPTIENERDLWRRVPPDWYVEDKNQGRIRPTSQAFDDRNNGTQLSIEISGEGVTPEEALFGYQNFYLAAVTAGYVRDDLNQIVVRDPLPKQPAHGLIIGQKTDSVRRKMAKQAKWVIAPPDPESFP